MSPRERLEAYREALLGELGSVSHAKTGDPRRVGEVNDQLAKVDAELAALDEDQAVEDVPVPAETTVAPDAPETAVKPGPKSRRATKPDTE